MKKLLFPLCAACFLLLDFTCYAQEVKWALYEPCEGVSLYNNFSDGVACFKKEGAYGVIDANGEIIIEPKYEYLSDFENGMAIVKEKGSTLYGVITLQGKYILKPEFSKIERFNNVFIPKKEGKYGIYDTNGKELIACNYSRFNIKKEFPAVVLEDSSVEILYNTELNKLYYGRITGCGPLLCVAKDSLYIDKAGREYSFDDVFRSSENAYLIKTNRSISLINCNNDTIKGVFPVSTYINDYLIAYIKGTAVLFDKRGDKVCTKYSYLMPKENGLIMFSSDAAQWGLMNEKGEILCNPKEIFVQYSNAYIAIIGEKKGDIFDKTIVNLADKRILPNRYKDIYDFKEGLARVQSFDDKYGFINEKGIEIIPTIYDNAKDLSEGLALVEKNDLRMLVNNRGSVVFKDNEYIRLESSFSENSAIAYDKQNLKRGYIYNTFNGESLVYEYARNSEKMANLYYNKGCEYGNAKKYEKAAECYIDALKHYNRHATAWNNLGVCFLQLNYAEDALQCFQNAYSIDPNFTMAKDNIAFMEAHIKNKNEQAATVTQNNGNDNWYDKLMNLGNTLINMGNAMNQNNGNYNSNYESGSYGNNGPGSGNYDTNNNSSESGSNAGNYKIEYDRWASLAKRHYESLTNLGYTYKEKGKEKGVARNESTYVLKKKSLREAQNEMRKIRLKASQNKVSIPKSQYEDITVEL